MTFNLLFVCRSRLRELTTKLVTLDPVQLGTKAMEVYWRKAYHEPVALARQLREGDMLNRVEAALVEAHLGAGIGHYHATISTLAARSSSSSSTLALDFGQSPVSSYGFSSVTPKKIRAEEGEEAWTEGAIVRCLVCLGDLGRYMVEFCSGAAALPARYYTLALRYFRLSGILSTCFVQGSTYSRATILSAGHTCWGKGSRIGEALLLSQVWSLLSHFCS